MRRTARWPFVLALPACLFVVFLCIAAWRLVTQEEAVDRERLRERLANAASLVARESERALAQAAADDRTSLSLLWDDRGLRRTAGALLPWSPMPDQSDEAPRRLFATGEDLEFAKALPDRAITEYLGLLSRAKGAARAGALARIARCQRKLGRVADASTTYQRLAEMGTVHLAGSRPAWLDIGSGPCSWMPLATPPQLRRSAIYSRLRWNRVHLGLIGRLLSSSLKESRSILKYSFGLRRSSNSGSSPATQRKG